MHQIWNWEKSKLIGRWYWSTQSLFAMVQSTDQWGEANILFATRDFSSPNTDVSWTAPFKFLCGLIWPKTLNDQQCHLFLFLRLLDQLTQPHADEHQWHSTVPLEDVWIKTREKSRWNSVGDGMDMSLLPETKDIGLLKRVDEDRVHVIHRFFI